jgi:hypothetical protein
VGDRHLVDPVPAHEVHRAPVGDVRDGEVREAAQAPRPTGRLPQPAPPGRGTSSGRAGARRWRARPAWRPGPDAVERLGAQGGGPQQVLALLRRNGRGVRKPNTTAPRSRSCTRRRAGGRLEPARRPDRGHLGVAAPPLRGVLQPHRRAVEHRVGQRAPAPQLHAGTARRSPRATRWCAGWSGPPRRSARRHRTSASSSRAAVVETRKAIACGLPPRRPARRRAECALPPCGGGGRRCVGRRGGGAARRRPREAADHHVRGRERHGARFAAVIGGVEGGASGRVRRQRRIGWPARSPPAGPPGSPGRRRGRRWR